MDIFRGMGCESGTVVTLFLKVFTLPETNVLHLHRDYQIEVHDLEIDLDSSIVIVVE
jgi:hypothetical protein